MVHMGSRQSTIVYDSKFFSHNRMIILFQVLWYSLIGTAVGYAICLVHAIQVFHYRDWSFVSSLLLVDFFIFRFTSPFLSKRSSLLLFWVSSSLLRQQYHQFLPCYMKSRKNYEIVRIVW